MTYEPFVGPSGSVFNFQGSSEEGAQLAFFGLESDDLWDWRAVRACPTYHLVSQLPLSMYYAYPTSKGEALFDPKN